MSISITSSNEFCISCHEMTIPYEEYKESPHYTNKYGITAKCVDCHLPNESGINGYIAKLFAKVIATKDILYHLTGKIDTKEKFEEQRLNMAHTVWKSILNNNSKVCKNCHSSKISGENHIKKNSNCISCHMHGKSIAHSRPWDNHKK